MIVELPQALRTALSKDAPENATSLESQLGYRGVVETVNREITFARNHPLASRLMNENAARLYLLEERAKSLEFGWRELIVNRTFASLDSRLPIHTFTISSSEIQLDLIMEVFQRFSIQQSGYCILIDQNAVLIQRDGHRVLLKIESSDNEHAADFVICQSDDLFEVHFENSLISSRLPVALIPQFIQTDIQQRLPAFQKKGSYWSLFSEASLRLFDRRSLITFAIAFLFAAGVGLLLRERLFYFSTALPAFAVTFVHLLHWARLAAKPITVSANQNKIVLQDDWGRGTLPMETAFIQKGELDRHLKEPELVRLLASPRVNRSAIVTIKPTAGLEILKGFVVLMAWVATAVWLGFILSR